ncbi:MAG TPA: AAA family ATPase, partial [Verrucomicrobiae bacterium]|nr:AAA family ATPase [Verrucomicrobiae bacterium]
MAKKVFIAATGQNCGKTTMSVSLMHLAKKKYGRVGFIKPVGPKLQKFGDLMVDKDAALMATTYGLQEDIALMSPLAMGKNFTRDYLDRRMSEVSLRACIQEAFHKLEQKYDYLIIEGAGHGGGGAIFGLSNAAVARMLDAPVVLVTEGGIGSVIDAVHLNMAIFEREKADVRLIMVNKLRADKRETSLRYLEKAFAGTGIGVCTGFAYSPILANPTLGHVADLLKLPLCGDQNERSRLIHHIHLGAASSQRVIDGLESSTLLVLTSSRDELIVTLSSLYHIPAYKEKIAGIVIAGYVPVSEISQQILDDSMIPYIRVHESTANVF